VKWHVHLSLPPAPASPAPVPNAANTTNGYYAVASGKGKCFHTKPVCGRGVLKHVVGAPAQGLAACQKCGM